ncbi:3-hydroxyacyl-CoA dehydrogenase family protein [Rhodocytophaga rosea]|uniref:3-hydroxyacyl-CoA dehydrogenase family protein n=1 Tax=Rhodocytophaga rosea TaxID=2704465 RepID=A0A6C0GPP3_9BACT|nr:3-hydroxyacyl-CoA dehydrogenase family protein [Rhodocytophaga rosea]QHT70028.1 3-hydroxyacyl-CoA dehydrogenase family protein [Rhodocytophaga rosea]
MTQSSFNTQLIPLGVVGLGLMGSSITTCMLVAGHPVIAIAPMPSDQQNALPRIREHLDKAYQERLITQEPAYYLSQLTITSEYSQLKDCRIVIESVIEDLQVKQSVFAKIESVVNEDAIIGSNTSAIPISTLQLAFRIPGRFMGLHWMEPAYTNRFLEIICGDLTDMQLAEWVYSLSSLWQKEPTLVRKDIRGFITNRLMYAMYREAFYLVENGYATVEDVDRACRNSPGYWMTLVGVFRWMDLTGLPAYRTVMQDLFPTLNNQTEVPRLIDEIVQDDGKGILNGKGFYNYTPEEAQLWKQTYEEFSYEIRRLALKYPADVVAQKLAGNPKEPTNTEKES